VSIWCINLRVSCKISTVDCLDQLLSNFDNFLSSQSYCIIFFNVIWRVWRFLGFFIWWFFGFRDDTFACSNCWYDLTFKIFRFQWQIFLKVKMMFFLLEKFLVASIVVRMAPFNFLRALNFFKQSTVSWRWIADATRSRCYLFWCTITNKCIESHQFNC
jgi:hypothetical protein